MITQKDIYSSSLIEQFIVDIRVINLGQSVIIDCCSTEHFEENYIYQLICLKCEEIQLDFYEHNRNWIYKDGLIDLLEFSANKQEDGKIFVYLYGRVVSLKVMENF